MSEQQIRLLLALYKRVMLYRDDDRFMELDLRRFSLFRHLEYYDKQINQMYTKKRTATRA